METTTKQSAIELLLNPFMAEDAWRWGTNHQCVKDGWRMATDGRVAIRVKTDEADWQFTNDQGKPVRFPSFSGIFDPYIETFTNRNLFAPMVRRQCGACDSTGRTSGVCIECGGSGNSFCHHCEHEHDCDECDGTGTSAIQCAFCEDLQITETDRIDRKYWYAIQSLPDVGIKHIDKLSLFVFAIDGHIGQGVVMHKTIDSE